MQRLEMWVDALSANPTTVPKIVLLVGGPGNGKTEAVEYAVHYLDNGARLDGTIVTALMEIFNAKDGAQVPRKVSIDIGLPNSGAHLNLAIVQDASVSEDGDSGLSPAAALAKDLQEGLTATNLVYLACVNRGVLDDALAYSLDNGWSAAGNLLKEVIAAVSLTPDARSCWPLERFHSVAVWPMDAESLVRDGEASAANQLLSVATEEEKWPPFGTCEAGEECPFCISRSLLSIEPNRKSLLQILRYYELASGKRWTFRDLFSLISLLLAGGDRGEGVTPCGWAATLLGSGRVAKKLGKIDSMRAPFLLMAAQYHHALFGHWEKLPGSGLKPMLKELGLEENATLMGLHHFLQGKKPASIPPTVAEQLARLNQLLDPALADPDQELPISGRTTLKYRDIDAHFSQSVMAGFVFVRKFHCLTTLDLRVLEALAEADALLSTASIRRQKPLSANRVQTVVREFACRVTRRALSVRAGVVRDFETVREFERVIDGDPTLLHQAVKQVEGLLNTQLAFEVPLNTTFGEPLMTQTRRAVLHTQKQKVKPINVESTGRPRSDLRFLAVGSGEAYQPIALTYELFRSVKELQGGMLAAALPRTVMALLDTTRARLAGRVVRDEEILDGSEIRIGLRDEVIVRELKTFIVRATANNES